MFIVFFVWNAVYHENQLCRKSDSHPTDLMVEKSESWPLVWAESRLWGELGLLGRLLTGKVACGCGMPESSASKWRQLVSYLIWILKTNTCFHTCGAYHLSSFAGWYWKKKYVPWKNIYSPWKRNLGSSGPVVLWLFGLLVLWSSGPVVLWSCGRVVLWSSGPKNSMNCERIT